LQRTFPETQALQHKHKFYHFQPQLLHSCIISNKMLKVIPFSVPQRSTLGLGHPFLKFLDLTQTHAGRRTPLDDWSACRRSR
jgi:hypothetical protein